MIPASLSVLARALELTEPSGACWTLMRLRASTRVQGPSLSNSDDDEGVGGFGVGLFFFGGFTCDSGAVADESDCGSLEMIRLPAALTVGVPAFLAFFFFFDLVADSVGVSGVGVVGSKPPGIAGGRDTTLGCTPEAEGASLVAPAFFFLFFFDPEEAVGVIVDAVILLDCLEAESIVLDDDGSDCGC